MDASTHEILLRASLGEDKIIILQSKGYLVNNYREGQLLSNFKGRQAALYANGRLVLTEKLELTLPGSEGGPPLYGTTEQAFGFAEVFTAGDSFADSRRQLRTLHIPQTIVIHSGADTAKTSDVYVDLQSMIARSQKPLIIDSANGHLVGLGFSYAVQSGDLEMGGPVEGQWFPKQKDMAQ